jgi:hypothetical protein
MNWIAINGTAYNLATFDRAAPSPDGAGLVLWRAGQSVTLPDPDGSVRRAVGLLPPEPPKPAPAKAGKGKP